MRQGAMPFELVTDLELTRGDKSTGVLAAAPPDQVIGGHVKLMSRFRSEPKDLFDTVVLHSEHLGQAMRIEDLGSDSTVFDQLTDRNKSRRRGHECVVR